MLAAFPTNVTPFFKNSKNIVVVWCGTNDSGVVPASTTWNNLVSYANAAHARGAKVIVVTMMSAINRDTFKNQLNPLIRNNWSGVFDALADVAADANLGADGAFNNHTYFSDGTHPTDSCSQTVIAPIIQTQIDSFT